MRPLRTRRFVGLAVLALLFAVNLRADNFYGDTVIDFDARGATSYDMAFFASTIYGGDELGYAYAGFASFYTSSTCNAGEAGAGMYLYNITKVGGQWVAGTVIIAPLKYDASGYDYTYYYNVPLPSSSTAYGSATCGDQTRDIAGWIDGY